MNWDIKKQADITIDFQDIPENVLRNIERKLRAEIRLNNDWSKYFVYMESHY